MIAGEEKQIEGLMHIIDDKRKIEVFPSENEGWFNIIFHNDGLETKLCLSSEAIQALRELWFELERRGLAA